MAIESQRSIWRVKINDSNPIDIAGYSARCNELKDTLEELFENSKDKLKDQSWIYDSYTNYGLLYFACGKWKETL